MTRKKKRAILITLSAICVLAFTGCGSKPSDPGSGPEAPSVPQKQTSELTQRQKDILQEQGLTIEYEQLEENQKQAILSIEKMLSEVEQKYDTELVYLGYVPGSPLEDETLTCYENGTPESRVITITRKAEDGKIVLLDDVACVRFSPQYEEAVSGICNKHLSKDGMQVFSSVYELRDNKQEDGALAEAAATSYIILDENTYSQGEVKTAAEAIFKEIEKEGAVRSMFRIYRIPHAAYAEITAANYREKIDQRYLYRAVLEIDADGDTKIDNKEPVG